MSKKVIIIGVGIAGMAVAARLAAKQYEVIIFEKNKYAGGKLNVLQHDGFTFDTGPSLFTQPYLLKELFTACGKHLSDYLSYQQLKISTRYFYEDGTVLTAYKDHDLLSAEIEQKLQIHAHDTISFLNETEQLYNGIGTMFLDEPIHTASTWFSKRTLTAIRALKPAYLTQSMHQYHAQRLKQPKLVQLFDRFATYNGSNPYKAPAMLCMIAHLEMNEGAYYPAGGMVAIRDALYKLCIDLGIEFRFDTPVAKIITEQKKVTGIIAKNETHKADTVISNSDVYFTYKDLLLDDAIANKIKRQERSSSAIIFYWGINKIFPQLDLHNILFSDNYKEEFHFLFDKKQLYNDPTIYINITAKMEPNHARPGCENWFVLINAPAGTNEQEITEQVKMVVLQKISRMLGEDIAPHIISEAVLSPAMIEQQTGSYLGALYGTASNDRMAAFMRHGNVSKKYKGLYFAGGTVHPGGGIPLCLRSAKIVSEIIG